MDENKYVYFVVNNIFLKTLSCTLSRKFFLTLSILPLDASLKHANLVQHWSKIWCNISVVPCTHTWLFPTVATIQRTVMRHCAPRTSFVHIHANFYDAVYKPSCKSRSLRVYGLSSQRLVPRRSKDTPFWQFLWFRQGQGWSSMERRLTGMFILSWNVNTKMYGTIEVKYKLMLFLCSLAVQCTIYNT